MITDDKIKSQSELLKIIKKLRNQGKKIVTLNGSFDILHPGHLFILQEAKKQGDILIVALNTDNSIKRNKGLNRPINNQDFRTKMMAGLQNVDYVTTFDEQTPIELLEKIKPDVHINGSEYGSECIEAPTVRKHGGKIHIVKRIDEYSTTNIINKICEVYSKEK